MGPGHLDAESIPCALIVWRWFGGKQIHHSTVCVVYGLFSPLVFNSNQEMFQVSSMDVTHAALVNKFWHFGGNERSQRFIERCIRNFLSICLLGPEGTPISWSLMDQTGDTDGGHPAWVPGPGSHHPFAVCPHPGSGWTWLPHIYAYRQSQQNRTENQSQSASHPLSLWLEPVELCASIKQLWSHHCVGQRHAWVARKKEKSIISSKAVGVVWALGKQHDWSTEALEFLLTNHSWNLLLPADLAWPDLPISSTSQPWKPPCYSVFLGVQLFFF